MADHVPPSSPAAQALAAQLRALIAQTVGNDPQLVQKMAAAMAAEPLLRAGAMVPEPAKAYLQAAMAQAAREA